MRKPDNPRGPGGLRIYGSGVPLPQPPPVGDEAPVLNQPIPGLPVSLFEPQPPPEPWVLVVTPGGEVSFECRSRPDLVRRTLLRWLLGWRFLPNPRRSIPETFWSPVSPPSSS